MKYWMLLSFFLLFSNNIWANFLDLPTGYQVVVNKIEITSSTIYGLVNNSNHSLNTLEFRPVGKQYFSTITFFFMLIMGAIYLKHKEQGLSELAIKRE